MRLFPGSKSKCWRAGSLRLPHWMTCLRKAAPDRDNLRLFGVQSNLTLPLAVGGASTVAALGFNGTRAAREWPEALVKRLRLVGQVFGNALARKHAVEVLRAGQARLEAGADLAGLGFYEVDFAERTVFVDDRFRDICGLPPGPQPASRPRVLDGAPASRRPAARAGASARSCTTAGSERLSAEYRFLHPTRGERWIHHVARVIARDATGRAVRTYGVLRDITERKRPRRPCGSRSRKSSG